MATFTNSDLAYSVLLQAYEKLESYAHIDKFDPILEALYATFLISPLENEDRADPEMQNLFQSYADSYMLVSVDSNIIDDVIAFQKLKVDYDVFTRGEAYHAKQSYYFFEQTTRLQATSAFLKRNVSSKSLDQWRSSDRHLAFVADMDAKFLYVPKIWLRHILLVKIAHV